MSTVSTTIPGTLHGRLKRIANARGMSVSALVRGIVLATMPDLSPSPLPRRRRGRPRLAEPSLTVSARIPTADHDRLLRIARGRDVTLAELLREILIRRAPR